MCGHQKEFPHLSNHTLWPLNTEQTFLRSDRFLPPPSFPRLPLACIKVPSWWCECGVSFNPRFVFLPVAFFLPLQSPMRLNPSGSDQISSAPSPVPRAGGPTPLNGGRLLPPPVSAAPVSVPSAASVYLTAPSSLGFNPRWSNTASLPLSLHASNAFPTYSHGLQYIPLQRTCVPAGGREFGSPALCPPPLHGALVVYPPPWLMTLLPRQSPFMPLLSPLPSVAL
jgi:hypothetical protein